MSKKEQSYSQAWGPWWKQAEDERQTAHILLEHGRWAPSCFHALQSIEMALKSLARKETTWDDWDRASPTGDEVDRDALTWDQQGIGGGQSKIHNLMNLLDDLHIWHRTPLERFRPRFQQLDSQQWYIATRYPEDYLLPTWHNIPKWHEGFTESDATSLLPLVDDVLTLVGEQLRLPIPPMNRCRESDVSLR